MLMPHFIRLSHRPEMNYCDFISLSNDGDSGEEVGNRVSQHEVEDRESDGSQDEDEEVWFSAGEN